MSDLQEILQILQGKNLTVAEFNQLEKELEKKKKSLQSGKMSPEYLEIMEQCTANRGEVLICPKCGSVEVVKNGRKDGRQRYLCRGCKRTFGDTYGTIFYHSKLSLKKWQQLIELVMYRQSLKTIKRDMKINLYTAWYNRHKICALIKQQIPQDKFESLTEGDEHYVPLSFQGIRNPNFFVEELHRMPRHNRSLKKRIEYVEDAGYEVVTTNYGKGQKEIKVYEGKKEYEVEGVSKDKDEPYTPYDFGKAKNEAIEINGLSSAEKRLRGISKEQVCILTLIDRANNTYLRAACVGRVTEKYMTKYLKDNFKSDAILVTDKHPGYTSFCRKYHLSLRQIPADKHTMNGYSLARVNSYHSRLAYNETIYKQVSSRYIDHYLPLFRWQDKNREEETVDKSSNILEMMTHKMRPLSRDNLSKKPFPFDLKGVVLPSA